MQRFTVIHSNTDEKRHTKTDVTIEATNLLRDNKEGGICVQIKLRNDSKLVLTSTTVSIDVVAENGTYMSRNRQYTYGNLAVESGESFGDEEIVTFAIDDAASAYVRVVQASFGDGTSWSEKLEQQKKLRKRATTTAIVLAGIIVVCAIGAILLNSLKDMAMEKKYTNAMELYNVGQYEEAAQIFRDISNYKDSALMDLACSEAISQQKALEEEHALLDGLLGTYECTQHYIIDDAEYKTVEQVDAELNKLLGDSGIERNTNLVGNQFEISMLDVKNGVVSIKFQTPVSNGFEVPTMKWTYNPDNKTISAINTNTIPLAYSGGHYVTVSDYVLTSGTLNNKTKTDNESTNHDFQDDAVTTAVFEKAE